MTAHSPITLPATQLANSRANSLVPDTRAFPRVLQADFLRMLAQWGNVRAAAKAVGVPRATAYRMRRECLVFRELWDAALLHARPQVEEVLADRALNGTQETVFYHGEEIATRTRYDSRLLLAHLGRLDRLEHNRHVVERTHGFDMQVAEFAGSPERDMSYEEEEEEGYEEERGAEPEATPEPGASPEPEGGSSENEGAHPGEHIGPLDSTPDNGAGCDMREGSPPPPNGDWEDDADTPDTKGAFPDPAFPDPAFQALDSVSSVSNAGLDGCGDRAGDGSGDGSGDGAFGEA